MFCFEVRHLFNNSTYCDTVDELVETYKPMLDWLAENIKGGYKLSPMDNAAFSDCNEDPWVGYYVSFTNEEEAILFKLRWLAK